MPFTDGIKVRTSARSGGGYLLSIIIDMWHRTGLVTDGLMVQIFWIGAATRPHCVGWMGLNADNISSPTSRVSVKKLTMISNGITFICSENCMHEQYRRCKRLCSV